jgi:hypothetical protein
MKAHGRTGGGKFRGQSLNAVSASCFCSCQMRAMSAGDIARTIVRYWNSSRQTYGSKPEWSGAGSPKPIHSFGHIVTV